jgi:hypothetical protein
MFLTSSAQNRPNPLDLSLSVKNDSHGTRHIKKGRPTAAAGWVRGDSGQDRRRHGKRASAQLPFLEKSERPKLVKWGKCDAQFATWQ